jgi:Rrf2 family protein
MLTQKAKYALRAVCVLADAQASHPKPIHEIAELALAPQKFMEAILLELRRHGLLASTRGKAGGYMLARPAAEVTIGDVIRIVDGPLALIPCASLAAYRPCADCSDPKTCTIRKVMRQVRDATAGILDNIPISELAAQPGLLELSDAQ